jgi:hypothetical protein
MRGEYVFTKDDHCITLYKKVLNRDPDSKNYGQKTDKLIGHYSSIESIVQKLIQLELIEKGTLKDLLVDLKEVTFNVKEFIKEACNGKV